MKEREMEGKDAGEKGKRKKVKEHRRSSEGEMGRGRRAAGKE